MVALEVVIDPAGAEAGAARVNRALDGIASRATSATGSVNNISRAFAGTAGITTVAQNIGSAANAFERLNLSAAGFATSSVLVGIGRISEDFASMGGRVGSLALGFSRLNPYLLAASVAVSGISAVVAAFSTKTRDAADSVRELSREAQTLQTGLSSISTARLGAGNEADTIRSLLRKLQSERLAEAARFEEPVYVRGTRTQDTEFARLDELNRVLPGINSYFSGFGNSKRGGGFQPAYALAKFPPYSQSSPEVPAIGRTQLEEYLNYRLARLPQDGVNPNGISDGLQFGRGLHVNATNEQQQERERERVEEMQRAMDKMVNQAQQMGEYMGDGVADLVLGLRSAREIAASIAQDFVRMGLKTATGALFSAVTQSFGATTTQQKGNGSNIQLPD